MVVSTNAPGWDADVYATVPPAPASIAGWGSPVGEITDAAEDATIELRVSSPSTLFLIWFTKLPEATDAAGHRAEVTGIQLVG